MIADVRWQETGCVPDGGTVPAGIGPLIGESTKLLHKNVEVSGWPTSSTVNLPMDGARTRAPKIC
jgi:hypothetical protein